MTMPMVLESLSPLDDDVGWADPADAAITWELDDMHAPHAVAPLAMDYLETVMNGATRAFAGMGIRITFRSLFFRGRLYIGEVYGFPLDELSAEIDALRAARRGLVPGAATYWAEEALPSLHRLYADIAAIDVDSPPGTEIAGRWNAAWAGMGEAWTIHFNIVGPAYRVAEDLADLYEAATPGASPGEAPRLTQGGTDVLQDVEEGIERLGALASNRASIAHWFQTEDQPTLEQLSALDGGGELVGEIRAFLADHGHLGQPFDDLMLPSWREEPALLLAELAKRVRRFVKRDGDGTPVEPNAERRRRLQVEAQALADGVRARLAGKAEALVRFEDQLAHALAVAPLTEVHNYWIDRMGQAALRALVVRVGARLAREGVLDHAEDVFFLHRSEIAEILASPADRRDLVRQRQDRLDRQRGLEAPSILGAAPPELEVTSRFVGNAGSAAGTDVLTGTGASAGIARGPARIVLGPDDFGRVSPGDIIVCPSSNPSWVPIFSIAGGLVTNTGGVLAHAAVVAREFALPAVVGAQGATTKIADGQDVEIDGTLGTIRLR